MKGIELLNPDKANEILEISSLMRRHGRIYVYYLSEKEDSVTLKVEQKKNPNGNYITAKELADRVKENFSEYTSKKIHVRPTAYSESPIEVVDLKYIASKMLKHKISNKNLAHGLGVTKSEMSGIINGKRPITQRTKAALYYYFQVRELSQTQKLEL